MLAQEASVAGVEADMRSAELEAEANQELSQDGLVSDVELRRSQILAEQLRERFRIEQERLSNTRNSMPSQLGAQEARLGQAQALFELRQQELEALRVRSAIDGILQEVPVEEGEQVTPGANLARVARPGELKAELRIAETQAKDLTIGQVARIDTRNGVIDGKVERIDPAAQEGTVTVDVELLGELPRGARPQLSVDGTVEIERLDDVIYISRPAYGQAFSTIGLFKLTSENIAQRVTVELGRSSVTTFEVVRGLDEGDRVILSDTSQYDDEDRLKLN
ncbi:MAG: HlyD family efflux transporter periplasmic adaptor subunit [Acidobacteriota bacterium]